MVIGPSYAAQMSSDVFLKEAVECGDSFPLTFIVFNLILSNRCANTPENTASCNCVNTRTNMRLTAFSPAVFDETLCVALGISWPTFSDRKKNSGELLLALLRTVWYYSWSFLLRRNPEDLDRVRFFHLDDESRRRLFITGLCVGLDVRPVITSQSLYLVWAMAYLQSSFLRRLCLFQETLTQKSFNA